MDIKALNSLGWIVMWGIVFFFMMRFGCGAHIGGHGHGQGAEKDEAVRGDASVKDPVCGMEVDPSHAAASASYGGSTYYFCSTSCRDKFQQAPQRYVGAATAQGGHHHG